MQSVIRFALITTAIGAVGGCTSYKPSPLEPQAELDQLRGRDVRAVEVTRSRPDTIDTQPSSTFDLTDGLDEAEVVSVALSLNPQLRAKRVAGSEARAALIAIGQWPNPELGLGFRPGVDGTSGYNLQADVLFQLLRPGERDAARSAGNARVEQFDAEIVADEYAVVAQVRQQRLAVLAADRQVALAQEALDLRQRSHDLVQEQRRIGEGTELDVAATDLHLAEARRERRQAGAELGVAKRELNRLLGLPPEYALTLNGVGEPLAVTLFEDVGDDELDRRLLAGRYELRAKEAAYQQSEQELRLAVLRQYPRLGVGPSFEREVGGDKSFGLGLSLELPLLNQNQGEIAEKRAARERTRAEYTELLHRLRADAFAARAEVRTTKAEVDAQEAETLPVLRRSQELFERAYRSRDLNIVDWITSQQRAMNARREYLKALVEYRRALINLEAAAGQPLSASVTQPTTQAN